MRKVIVFLFFQVFLNIVTKGQCPSPSFIINDTACQGAQISFTNTSLNGTNFSWDFCTGDLLHPSYDTSSEPLNTLLQTPAGVITISESGSEYVFVCSRDNGRLVRLEYSNGIENPSTGVTDLGNLSGTVGNPNGIAAFQESGVWYLLLTDVFSGRVGLTAFGNGVSQAPTLNQIIINGGLSLPRSIKVFKEASDSIFAFITNYTGNTLAVFSFGTSILNAPQLLYNIPVPNSNGLIALDLIKDCNHLFGVMCSYNSTDIAIADFGSSITSSLPTFTSMSAGPQRANDISIVSDGQHFFNVIASGFGVMILQQFGSSLVSPVLEQSSQFSVASNSISGSGMFKKNSKWFGLFPQEYGNILSRLDFHNPCDMNIYESIDFSPSSIIYNNSDTMEVTLTASDNTGNVSRSSIPLIVHENPHSLFSVEGFCIGAPTFFSNNSSVSGAIITGYLWDFGGGDTSTLQDPIHTFSALGNQQVSLTAISNYGCTAMHDTIFSIEPLPSASFSAGNGCSESRLLLTDASTVNSGSIVGWSWDFGNGVQLNGVSPDYGYPQGGNYVIQLTITTQAGCKDSTSRNVFIQDRPNGAFTVANTCNGLPVQFTDLSTISGSTIVSRWWSFGDGDTSVVSSPVHIYPSGSGNYPLEFIVYAANGCSDTINQNLRISNIPTSSFTSTPNVVCTGTEVHFNDLSSVIGDTISGWSWNFGDGTFDTISTSSHVFNTPGLITVSLTAYAPTSCPGTLYTQTINVLPGPVPAFSAPDACLGSPSYFTDITTPGVGDFVTAVNWSFGTGDSSIGISTTYNYGLAGSYQVIEMVTTDAGCVATDTQAVYVRSLPTAQFTTGLPCNGQEVMFYNNSSSDSTSSLLNATWNFGDPASSSNSSSLFNPVHIFSGLSSYDVALIVETNFGCKDTVINTVNVLPSSSVNFTYSPTCYGDLMEFFNPGSPIDSYYLWNFGDNQFNQLQEPAHFYAFPGSYNVTLTVTAASGCVTSASRLVTVSPIPQATFSTAPACLDASYQFINQSSISTGSITSQDWRIAGQQPFSTDLNPVYTFSDTGAFSVTLQVTSDIGCSASYTGIIRSYPLPKVDFNFNPQFGNPPLAVTFQDQSIGGNTYAWNFGDGASGISGNQVQHTYQDTGFYYVREIVSSIYGCVDSTSKGIYVIRPVLDIAVIGDSSYTDGNYFYIVARLANLGTRPIDSVSIEARLENGSTIKEKYIGLIPFGQEGFKTYAFKAAFLLNGNTLPAYYCISADSPNGQTDDVPENNLKCFNRADELQLTVYPNPFRDEFIIDLFSAESQNVQVELFNQQGELVKVLMDQTISSGLTRLSSRLTAEASGIYTLRVTYRNKVIHRQVVKN